MQVQWLTPENSLQALSRDALQDSNIVGDFAAMVARKFTLAQNLSLTLGGEGVPEFNPESMTLLIPYSYLADVVRAQAELVEERQQALSLGMDMVEYTLYHMFGHVLAGNQSPDADDEAEAISTWLMLTQWPNGGEQWFNSAQAFATASQKLDGPLADYWHAHALYKSRQRKIECAILGSNPAKYERLLSVVLEADKRRSVCIDYWQNLDRDTRRKLKSFMIQ